MPEQLITFITVLSRFGAVLYTVRTAHNVWGAVTYDYTRKMNDQLNGIQRTFPIMKYSTIAVICWAWIISVA